MNKLHTDSIFTTGPFADASDRLLDFSANIYFSYLIVRSLMDEVDAQKFHAEAVELGDEDIIVEAEKDLAHLDNALKRACLLMTHFDGIDA